MRKMYAAEPEKSTGSQRDDQIPSGNGKYFMLAENGGGFMVKTSRYTGMFILSLTIIVLMELSCHASPRVQVGKTVYDAGTVPEGMDVTHEFMFRNIGDRNLLIKPKPC